VGRPLDPSPHEHWRGRRSEFLDHVFKGRSYPFLKFDYYLNLTPNDRNLEYDQKSNLAPEADKDLRWPP
jgi:hypothetical protein